MIKVKINLALLDKTAFFKGKNGAIWCDLVLWENRNGEDQYGNHGTVKQDMGKDRRGEQTPILGNWKDLDQAKQAPQQQAPPSQSQVGGFDDGDSIPF